MINEWECEKCGKVFLTEKETLKHEKVCKPTDEQIRRKNTKEEIERQLKECTSTGPALLLVGCIVLLFIIPILGIIGIVVALIWDSIVHSKRHRLNLEYAKL